MGRFEFGWNWVGYGVVWLRGVAVRLIMALEGVTWVSQLRH